MAFDHDDSSDQRTPEFREWRPEDGSSVDATLVGREHSPSSKKDDSLSALDEAVRQAAQTVARISTDAPFDVPSTPLLPSLPPLPGSPANPTEIASPISPIGVWLMFGLFLLSGIRRGIPRLLAHVVLAVVATVDLLSATSISAAMPRAPVLVINVFSATFLLVVAPAVVLAVPRLVRDGWQEAAKERWDWAKPRDVDVLDSYVVRSVAAVRSRARGQLAACGATLVFPVVALAVANASSGPDRSLGVAAVGALCAIVVWTIVRKWRPWAHAVQAWKVADRVEASRVGFASAIKAIRRDPIDAATDDRIASAVRAFDESLRAKRPEP